MNIEHIIHRAKDDWRYYTFTVVFQTKHMTAEDADMLSRQAEVIVRRQVACGADREIKVSVRNRQTIAIFHYTGNISKDCTSPKLIEEDFAKIFIHIAALVEVFDAKEEKPNKAPEPTTMAVTPRAIERDSK